MLFSTQVHIPAPPRLIRPADRLLFVGSCFADGMGQRFRDNAFVAEVNPRGTMYNPISIRHTVELLLAQPQSEAPDWVFLTLGTNHVYRLRESGQVVDNCQKRPARLFSEEVLSVGECAYQLRQALDTILRHSPQAQVVLTVSPIRYAKYGFHASQLSKATLLLAVEEVCQGTPSVYYFPAYELLMDELRDYRFYKADMLHPSDQAADYIWERLQATLLSPEAQQMVADWQPLRLAQGHKPLHPGSDAHKAFVRQTECLLAAFREKYPANRVAIAADVSGEQQM